MFVVLVLFFVPPRLLFRPFWPCVPLLGVFFGVPFWAPRVFGILLELTGFELARPFRGPFSWDARRQGCFLASCPWFCFSPFVLFRGFTRFPRRPANGSTYGRPGRSTSRPLARVRARGSPSEGGGLVPSCFGILLPFFVWQRVTGTLSRALKFLLGRGRFCLPPQALFHTHVFCPRPRFFFFFSFLAFEARARRGELYEWSSYSENGISNSECCPRMPRNFPKLDLTQWESSPKHPGAIVIGFLYARRGKRCAFFFAARFSGDCPLFSQVLSFVGFCVGGFLSTSFGLQCGVAGRIFYLES